MCNSDLRHDLVRSWLRDLDEVELSGRQALTAGFHQIESEAEQLLGREGFERETSRYVRAYDLRYFGQQWSVAVECESVSAPEIRKAFEVVYQRLFGYVQEGGQIEIVNLRLSAIGKLPALDVTLAEKAKAPAEAIGTRSVWLDVESGFRSICVYDGTRLAPGHEIDGPAVIEEATTTLFIGVGDRMRITDAGNYHVQIATQ
jgi:N-methylhydantoinase A